MILSISYDLRAPGRNYTDLYEAIKRCGSTWCRPLESLWLVQTTMSTAEVRDYLRNYVDSNDALFISASVVTWASLNVNTPSVDWLKGQLV